MEDQFLTVAEIAERLRVNQQTVRNWIDRGEMAAVRIGARRIRVRQSELDRFIEAGSPAPVEAPRVEDEVISPRQEFSRALETAAQAEDDSELVVALKELARASEVLAKA